MGTPYVIGLDAGGTHSRAVCARLDGTVLGRGLAGGGSPNHNHDAHEQVNRAVVAALANAHADPADAVALAAGLAGLDRPDSSEWGLRYVEVPGLDCPKHVVNDAVTAHVGAFAGGVGIIIAAGTGSRILAIDAAGRETDNSVYQHYAGGARHLAFDAMARILVTDPHTTSPEDAAYIRTVLELWHARDVLELRARILALATIDHNEIKRQYGRMAPLVTAAADRSMLADAAVTRLAETTATGVRLLVPHVALSEPQAGVPVSSAGSLANDPAFLRRLAHCLAGSAAELRTPRVDPCAGAVLYALRALDLPIDADVVRTLEAPHTENAKTPQRRPQVATAEV